MVRPIYIAALVAVQLSALAAASPLAQTLETPVATDALPSEGHFAYLEGRAVPSVPQVAPVLDGISEPVSVGAGLASCQTAVRLDLTWYGARIVDHRPGAFEAILPHAWTESTLQQVPVYSTVTQTVVPGIPGLVEPVTRTVTEISGYDTRSVVTPHSVDLAVTATWTEDYLEWGTYHDILLVTAPVGLPYLATGEGSVVLSCGEPILDHVPDPAAEGVEAVCVVCTHQPADGWSMRLLGLDVHVAGSADYASYRDSRGITVCPTDLLDTVAARIAGLHLSALDEARQLDERRAAGEEVTPPSPAAAPASASALHVPASAGLYLLVVVVVTLFAAAVLGRRKR